MNAPQPIKSHFATLAALAIGADHENGKFAGLITLQDGKHVAVILLPNKSDKRLMWADAMAWATEAGGQLPTRPVAALLYANLKSEFAEEWHWTNETATWDESCAWVCSFGNGDLFSGHKDVYYAARAVRLIHITD